MGNNQTCDFGIVRLAAALGVDVDKLELALRDAAVDLRRGCSLAASKTCFDTRRRIFDEMYQLRAVPASKYWITVDQGEDYARKSLSISLELNVEIPAIPHPVAALVAGHSSTKQTARSFLEAAYHVEVCTVQNLQADELSEHLSPEFQQAVQNAESDAEICRVFDDFGFYYVYSVEFGGQKIITHFSDRKVDCSDYSLGAQVGASNSDLGVQFDQVSKRLQTKGNVLMVCAGGDGTASDWLQSVKQRPVEVARKARPLFHVVPDDRREKFQRAWFHYDRITQHKFLERHAFGSSQWKDYFGKDVHDAPDLPREIVEILNHRCPFKKGKLIKDTHVLVFIPCEVSSKSLTLKLLAEDHPSSLKLKAPVDEYSPLHPRWVLLAMEPITNNEHSVESYSINVSSAAGVPSKLTYCVPSALEVAVCNLSRFLQTQQMLLTSTKALCSDSARKCGDIVVGLDKGRLQIECRTGSCFGRTSRHADDIGTAAIIRLEPDS